MSNIYVAGPMRGIPDWNRPAFLQARQEWEGRGYRVFCPSCLVTVLPWQPDSGEDDDHLLSVCMIDLACIYACEAIALLPGWQGSRGATMEVAVGLFLKFPFYDAFTAEDILVQPLPWQTAAPPTSVQAVEVVKSQIQGLSAEECKRRLVHLLRTL